MIETFHRYKRVMRTVVVVFALALSATRAEATSVVRFDFAQLCEQAPTIVHVRVTGVEVVASDDRVRTRTTFEILEPVKGTEASTVVLTLPGGRLESRHVTVPGMPTFEIGQETVIFLSEPGAHGSPWPVGLTQGCYRVIEDQVELQRGRTPIPAGAAFKPADARPYRVSLPSFLSKIRETTDAR